MKKIIGILCIVTLLLTCTGCDSGSYKKVTGSSEECYSNGYFTKIVEWRERVDFNQEFNCCIVYANDTKVKYLITYSGHKFGITPLYNSDGSLQLYEENK